MKAGKRAANLSRFYIDRNSHPESYMVAFIPEISLSQWGFLERRTLRKGDTISLSWTALASSVSNGCETVKIQENSSLQIQSGVSENLKSRTSQPISLDKAVYNESWCDETTKRAKARRPDPLGCCISFSCVERKWDVRESVLCPARRVSAYHAGQLYG